jgi:hypothetical protein
MRIDHINISAPMELLEEVRDFYCSAFDLSDGFRPNFSTNGFWLYAGDEPIIHLSESLEHHGNSKQGYFDHFALRATGVGNVLERLNKIGVEYSTSHVPEIGLTQIFCKDPCGTGVEVNFIDEPLKT